MSKENNFKNDDTQAGNRIVLSTESVNSYGFRVLTSGIDLEGYKRNPVMLYMHERGQIIGLMKDIRIEEDGKTLTAEPSFDEASELSQRCKKQWEFGSLKMSSISFELVESSEDPELMAEGQKFPTVTKCRLTEVSLVDIGSNPDSIRLTDSNGDVVDLSNGEMISLAFKNSINSNIHTNQNEKKMDVKKLALSLGLHESATEVEVETEIMRLKADSTSLEQMKKESIEQAVNLAIKEHKIAADKKDEFVNLGAQIGLKSLSNILGCIKPEVKLSALINPSAGENRNQAPVWKKLSDVPADKLEQLKAENNEEYHRLYREEYGFDF